MPTAALPERKRVPLTKFHNATGEYLDMALRSPIILTSHGRKRQIVADSAYFEKIEMIARGNIIDALNIKVHSAADMPEALRQQILATQPTAAEIANDRWDD